MSERRTLIVNADDLGMTAGVNAGIAAAFERGIVTSASLMVRQGAAAAGAAFARERPRPAVGLHLDLVGWDYERRRAVAEPLDLEDPEAVERECRAQLELFRELTGQDPTHLDSHRHLHTREPLAGVAARLADELGVPLRGREASYEGRFFARGSTGDASPAAIGVDALIALLRGLPAGATEIGCHPAAWMQGESSYSEERSRELQALCDPAVRKAIESEGIRLVSFEEWRRGS